MKKTHTSTWAKI